jgi:hypothetical protein
MLVAGAVEIEGGKPRRARLNVIEGFGKPDTTITPLIRNG